jgi:DNA-binding NtrC family response regulator
MTIRPTVLIVEDVEDVREFVAEVLSHKGYHVLTASGLPEAEAVRERLRLDALALVITNLRLTRNPHAREGIDLILRWHALDSQLPFILISSDLHSNEVANLLGKAVRCLAKPFTMEVLRNTVQEALRA